MGSFRNTIANAVVNGLNDIKVSNGFNTNLGTTGKAKRPLLTSNPVATLPTAIVSVPGETKGPASTSYYEAGMRLEIEAVPDPDQALAEPETITDELVQDIEQKLLQLDKLDPPLGVPGVQRIVLRGHEKLPIDENLDGAVVECTVEYRHALDDPGEAPS